MTEIEAINVLKMVEAHGCLVIEAKVKAIQALEEIQQYRAIGTVEEFQKLRKMFGDDFSEMSEVVKRILKEYPEYQSIGTIEEFKALKEKAEPRKVIEHKTPYFVHWQCGNCGAEFYSGQTFCDDCGHSADWGELLK